MSIKVFRDFMCNGFSLPSQNYGYWVYRSQLVRLSVCQYVAFSCPVCPSVAFSCQPKTVPVSFNTSQIDSNRRIRLLTLSQTTNFRLFQTQRCLQMTIFNLMKMAESPPLGRKHCGKRRNCSLQTSSPFPTVFTNDLYCRHIKSRACLGKG